MVTQHQHTASHFSDGSRGVQLVPWNPTLEELPIILTIVYIYDMHSIITSVLHMHIFNLEPLS